LKPPATETLPGLRLRFFFYRSSAQLNGSAGVLTLSMLMASKPLTLAKVRICFSWWEERQKVGIANKNLQSAIIGKTYNHLQNTDDLL